MDINHLKSDPINLIYCQIQSIQSSILQVLTIKKGSTQTLKVFFYSINENDNKPQNLKKNAKIFI